MTDFKIAHQCPQCGAPAELTETTRLFQCGFCRVKSFLLEKGFFRYVLPDAAPPETPLIYVPYWRFKGMAFHCVENDIGHRVVDVSLLAVSEPGLPESLGLRSQALKLRFLTPETGGRFLRPTRPMKEAMDQFEQRYAPASRHPVHQSFIGECLSLIYAPVYVDGCVMDAVLNQPVCPGGADAEGIPPDIAERAGDPPGRNLRFVPALCPGCGWDLSGEEDTLALACFNCDSVWHAGSRRLDRLPFGHIPDSQPNRDYLPFWRIRADVSGLILDSRADLVRVANLPVVARPEWEEAPFHFWVPAFKVSPQAFLRIAQGLTVAQPAEKPAPSLPKGTLHPVTLPVTEAVESLKMLLAAFIRPKKKLSTRLAHMDIRPKSALLVYAPFERGHHELLSEQYRLAINRNMLKLTGNI